MINVIICDDDMLIRESLKIILSIDEQINVVETCENGKECLVALENNKADVLLLDMRMPVMNGCETLKAINEKGHNVKSLVLTTFDEDEFIEAAIKYGSYGYLLKTSKPQKIISAIKSVAQGNGLFEVEIIAGMYKNSKPITYSFKQLTERENEIVKLIAQGLANKEIAETLYLSEGTVKNHISSILTKLNLKHRTQIAIEYLQNHDFSNGRK